MSDKKHKSMNLKYIGGGYVVGVPARDLTPEEFSALSDDLKSKVLVSGFYQTTVENGQKEE